MSFAYLPWYTGDYFRDTRGLSMAGHGCYLLLLAFCWDSQGPLPLDEEEIANICGARSQEERAGMQRVLHRFFVRMEDGWYQPRMQREVEKACAISIKRKAAGWKGYEAKAKHLPSKSLASAEQVPLTSNPNTIPTPTPEDQKPMSGSQANTDAIALLQFLNSKAGRHFRPTATTLKPILARLREGFTVAECKAVVMRRCRAWMADEKMRPYLRPATVFGAEKFAQYVGEVPPEEKADEQIS